MLRILALLIVTLPTVLAHEGQHQAESVLWHVLSQADHLAFLGMALAVALGGAWLLRQRRGQPARDRA